MLTVIAIAVLIAAFFLLRYFDRLDERRRYAELKSNQTQFCAAIRNAHNAIASNHNALVDRVDTIDRRVTTHARSLTRLARTQIDADVPPPEQFGTRVVPVPVDTEGDRVAFNMGDSIQDRPSEATVAIPRAPGSLSTWAGVANIRFGPEDERVTKPMGPPTVSQKR